MNLKISLKKFTTYSDRHKTPIKTLRITISKHDSFKFNLYQLIQFAKKEIGEKQKVICLWRSPDKKAEIWAVQYA